MFYTENMIIRNNLFSYNGIELKKHIVNLTPRSSELDCFHKNMVVDGNVFDLVDCTVNSYYEIAMEGTRATSISRNAKFTNNRVKKLMVTRVENVEISDNIIGKLNLQHCSNCVVDNNLITNFSNFTALTDAKVIDNRVSISEYVSNTLYSMLAFGDIQLNTIFDGNYVEYVGDTPGVYALGYNSNDFDMCVSNNTFIGCGIIRNNNYLTHTGKFKLLNNRCDANISPQLGNMVCNIANNTLCSGVTAHNSIITGNKCTGASGNYSSITNNQFENGSKITISKGSKYMNNIFKNFTDPDVWLSLYYNTAITIEDSVIVLDNIFISDNNVSPKYFIEAFYTMAGVSTLQEIYTSNNIFIGKPRVAYELRTKPGIFLTNGLKKYLVSVENNGSLITKLVN